MKKNIHKFYLNDKHIVLDIPNGSVHVVDKLIYDLVDDFLVLNRDEIIHKYKNIYELNDINEALDELQNLQKEKLLFNEDVKFPKDFYNPLNIIKAMCLNVAHDCNLKCTYCFASQGDFKGQKMLMNYEIGKKALDFILKNSGNRRNLEVDFFGGEPLLNFKLVKDLVKYGREEEVKYNKHFRFTITTNGMLLKGETAKFINENMDNVVLSLDGRKCINDCMRPTNSNKSSYDKIVPNFQDFVKNRGDKDYYIRGTFTNKNLDFSKDLKEFYDLGFEKTSIEPVVTDEKEEYAIREEHLNEILNEYEEMSKEYMNIRKKNNKFLFFHFMIDLSQGPCIIKRAVGCGAGSEYIAVTPDGNIYPCHQFVGEEKFKLGDVFNGIKNTQLRDEFKSANVFNKEGCSECWARYYCSGGCHANSFYAHNDLKKPYKIGCEIEKKRIECAISIIANENE